jgi:hypothetical protein
MSPEFKYKITLENADWVGAQYWCEDHFGEFGIGWYKLGIDPAEILISGVTKTTWYFKNEQDAAHFLLKWS